MIRITVQVSLYPLGQAALSPAIDDALRILREHGLDVEVGPMSSLVAGEQISVFTALQSAFSRVAEQGPVVMVATSSNACPMPGKTGESVIHKTIVNGENGLDEPYAPAAKG